MMPSKPLRIAHRGMPRRARENTLASFSLALLEGAQGIELDVHATADGMVVVHHDPALADGRAINQSALDDLRPAPGPLEIPTLGEVLALVNGSAELFVEIKGESIEPRVLEALDQYCGPAAIHSFDHASIGRCAALGAQWPLGLLTEEPLSDVPATLERYGAADFWPHEPLVSHEVMLAVHGMGGRVIPWTVNAPARMRELAALGADGICTDDVSAMRVALG